MSRVIVRVTANVTTKARKHSNSGSLPASITSRCHQTSTPTPYADDQLEPSGLDRSNACSNNDGMGFGNPPVPWRELERRLSGRPAPLPSTNGDGGDSPAWSRKREA